VFVFGLGCCLSFGAGERISATQISRSVHVHAFTPGQYVDDVRRVRCGWCVALGDWAALVAALWALGRVCGFGIGLRCGGRWAQWVAV